MTGLLALTACSTTSAQLLCRADGTGWRAGWACVAEGGIEDNRWDETQPDAECRAHSLRTAPRMPSLAENLLSAVTGASGWCLSCCRQITESVAYVQAPEVLRHKFCPASAVSCDASFMWYEANQCIHVYESVPADR